MSKYPRWVWVFAAATLFLSAVPYLYALVIQPDGTLYLGVHSNYDDHSVYAAWMKQAQEGRFFFDNRFTNDPQPRLTVNLYFWAVGTFARVVPIPWAAHIAKAVFGLLFLLALYRLVRRVSESRFTQVICMCLAVFGAGVGWTVWRRYGMLNGPIDVWQPEALTFPSLMQNGLFCAALWLICVVWNKILDARESWKPVFAGALAALLLTNIHTYDTLTIAIVGLGFLATQISARTFTFAWLARTAAIAAGAVPAILWFAYVRANDPVFRSRAETRTFSPGYFDILVGYGPLLLLAIASFTYLRKENKVSRVIPIVAALFLITIAVVQRLTGFQVTSLWLDVPQWLALAGLAIVLCYLYSPREPIHGLLFSWTLMNLVAMYYPGLFQRKLAMGMSVPIGIGAGIILARALERIPKWETRRSLGALTILALSITSIRWLEREARMANDNISNSTMQPVYWFYRAGEKPSPDVARILAYLRDNRTEQDLLVSHPGQAVPASDSDDEFYIGIPSLEPVMTGWAGIKSWASHWSETPDCRTRKGLEQKYLFSDTATEEQARAVLKLSKATFIIVPKGEVARAFRVPPLSFYQNFGKVVYDGDAFALVHVQ